MNVKKSALLAAAALAFVAGSASAESLNFSLSSDAFRFGLSGPLSRVLSGVDGQYDLGYLQHRGNGNDSFAAHVGALATGDAGLRDIDLKAGVGLRAVFVGGDGENGGAIAPGVQLDARLPGYDRIGLIGTAYYAPGVVSFGDVDDYRDLSAVLSYQINRSAAVFGGYRNVRIGVDHAPDQTIDNGLYGGISLTF
ncbi:YfaZ family outer membrane protein [Solimonas terrae]|uniref:Porin n=1 Tax=Solimonas terrae TaxID=1396819 RepID=A0A6M2BPT9_9GAMM|nr:YfaZ family outer membrane protein [Solimonas terrae]NGY04225.1 hypothetical protein [Solimonas terrae]